MVGSLFIIIQTFLLGYLEYVKDEDTFLFISYIAQIFGGFGAGANSTASMAILSSFEQSEREQYIGWVEAATGIGLLFGPLLGAALFTIGGYITPFITFGKLNLFYSYIFQQLSTLLLILSLSLFSESRNNSNWKLQQNRTNPQQPKRKKILA